MKKAICAVICAVSLLLCAACAGNGGETGKAPDESGGVQLKDEKISLIYCSGDSFNPYTAKTKYNKELSRLIYDPLIKYDNSFEPVYCLAQSAVLSGKTCTVTLKTASWTDNTAVTADDVVYSYNLAKKSAAYGSALYEVTSAAAAGNTVTFTLNAADPYFLNLLDFPILKAGSDTLRDSDGIEIPPIGSGRYYLSEDKKLLLRNGDYFGTLGEVSEISLLDVPDEASASHYVEVGAADVYYAGETVENVARMSGRRADVNTNNFVYIGINAANGLLDSGYIRYAISAAIDRAEICHSAYYDNATPASGFFNPVIKETAAVQSLKTVADLQISVENLGKIGYNISDNGYYANASGKHPVFTLLVNSDNPSRVAAANLIANQCRAAGIEIKVIMRDYAGYVAALESGNFQLYLGEIRVLANMDLYNLVVPGGSAAYGVKAGADESGAAAPTVCQSMIAAYKNGECSLSDLAGAFLTEMPQIPVCYRKGMLFYTSRIESDAQPSLSDIYLSFENYKFK
ncbi:MAG: hypothetical protein IKZ47_01675 [Clostridia bacterium]|nr:hypothetical protein [Clostridia bacterium]